MKNKKTTISLLSASILTLSLTTALASDFNFSSSTNASEINEMQPISAPINHSHFNGVRGKVTEIKEMDHIKGLFLTIEGEEGQISNMIVRNDIYIIGSDEIKIGSIITGYYDVNKPMIMIYPAQYNVEVLYVEDAKNYTNIKVDFFNENLVSNDNTLKIVPSETTKIVNQADEIYSGDLVNRHLAVVYDISTKSIPAQTVPSKIIVLTEEEVVKDDLHYGIEIGEDLKEVILEEVHKEHQSVIGDVSTMEIIVENKKVDLPSAYMNEEGTVMVPLRGIAESLGFKVSWNATNSEISLNEEIFLTIDVDRYTYKNTEHIQLGTAPELKDGTTYVPLNFFREVAKVNNAYVFEGQIVIDNGEKME